MSRKRLVDGGTRKQIQERIWILMYSLTLLCKCIDWLGPVGLKNHYNPFFYGFVGSDWFHTLSSSQVLKSRTISELLCLAVEERLLMMSNIGSGGHPFNQSLGRSHAAGGLADIVRRYCTNLLSGGLRIWF